MYAVYNNWKCVYTCITLTRILINDDTLYSYLKDCFRNSNIKNKNNNIVTPEILLIKNKLP